MSKQVFNPYLPDAVYIPDGEPHVFGDRVYVYGSHDLFNGKRYCPGDYDVWSAPVADLKSWRDEGVIYKRRGPHNRLGFRCMWAPDVVQGPDGRFYLYYSFGFKNWVNVAVCSTPAGKYEFLGEVRYPDGTLYGKTKGDMMCFDPAVIMDDGHAYLYSGFSPRENLFPMLHRKGIHNVDGTGGHVLELESNMLTVKGKPKMLIPGYKNSAGTGFEGHEMYEASSIRKVGGKFYFIYSSIQSHELCYAVSDYPDRDFVYGGTIISNGDIGLYGRKTEDALNYWGNNHGSIVQADGQWYVFYHRQTNKTEQSRQGCAERIEIKDGKIEQVEMTSCGLNGGPLEGIGTYPAYIACNLFSKEGALKCAYGMGSKGKYKLHPCITQTKTAGRARQFIRGMRDGATAGFKYFNLHRDMTVSVTVRGDAGTICLYTDTPSGTPVGKVSIDASKGWTKHTFVCSNLPGKSALYFTYIGPGKADFLEFELI